MSGPSDWAGFARLLAGPLQLSALARQRAEDAVIDTAACIAAGACEPAVRAAAGQGAAFRWAVAAAAIDFDDYDRPSIGHPSAVLVPVVLALAPGGAAALAAYVAGLEAIDRLGEMVNPEHYDRGWHATATLGTIGAAAAAARCLGLGPGPMLAALAIAAAGAAGLKANFGTMAKPLGVGFAAARGIAAAELAAAGADARAGALDQFCALMGPERPRVLRWGAERAIEEFGLVVKLHPCCGYLGRIIPACIALSREIDVADIAGMRIEAPPRNAGVIRFGIPATTDEARFSAPYCAATALLTGGLGLGDFTPEAIRRPEMLALARRIRLEPRPGPQSPVDLAPEDPDRIDVTLLNGHRTDTVTRVLHHLPGSPEFPVTREDLLAKLHACGGGAAAPLLAGLAALDDLAPLRRWLETLA